MSMKMGSNLDKRAARAAARRNNRIDAITSSNLASERVQRATATGRLALDSRKEQNNQRNKSLDRKHDFDMLGKRQEHDTSQTNLTHRLGMAKQKDQQGYLSGERKRTEKYGRTLDLLKETPQTRIDSREFLIDKQTGKKKKNSMYGMEIENERWREIYESLRNYGNEDYSKEDGYVGSVIGTKGREPDTGEMYLRDDGVYTNIAREPKELSPQTMMKGDNLMMRGNRQPPSVNIPALENINPPQKPQIINGIDINAILNERYKKHAQKQPSAGYNLYADLEKRLNELRKGGQ